MARWHASSGSRAGPTSATAGISAVHPSLATSPGAGRRWIDVDGARVRKGLHELTDPALVVALDDHVEGMLAVNDRFALDHDALPPDIRPAQVVEERRARIRVGSPGVMLVADDEECHASFDFDGARFSDLARPPSPNGG